MAHTDRRYGYFLAPVFLSPKGALMTTKKKKLVVESEPPVLITEQITDEYDTLQKPNDIKTADRTSGASALRRKSEKTVASQSPPAETFIGEPDAKRLLHELQVQQLELEMQNREMQMALAEQSALRMRYTDLYNMAPVGYLTISENGLILDANLTAATLLRVEAGYLLNRPKLQFIFSEDQDIFYQYRNKINGFGELQELDLRMVRANGELFWAHLQTVSRQKGEYLIIFSDISERMRAEELLKKSHDRLLTVLNGLDAMVYVADFNTFELLFVNDYLKERFGEIVGQRCWKVLQTEQTGPCEFCSNDKLFDAAGNPTGIYKWEFRNTANGNWYDINDRAIVWIDGRIVRLEIATDITERKKSEEALKEAHDLLETRVAERTDELNRSLEQTRNVSRELSWAEDRERERIAAELHDRVGQSLLLAKMKLDAMANKIISDSLHKAAVEASSLLATSIHDIRTLTFRLRPPILDNAGIETALEWLCSSINEDYGLQIDFKDDRQPKPLPAEIKYSLYQVVRELLLNVVKHAGTEKAQLSIKTNDHNIVIRVTDNGAGFNQTETERNNFITKGYGLHNVKQRIELMGGSFVVESDQGNGTSATLTIPVTEYRQQKGLARRNFGEQTGLETGSPLPSQLMDGLQKATKILLADDHLIFREGLRSLIENGNAGVVIGEAGDGAEAVRLAGELEPDLVIMDLTMPVMNGIDATREITTKYHDIRVIALSMERDRFFVVEALKAGASGYLPKDTAFTEILDAITTVASGEHYVTPKISALLIKEFLHRIPEDMAPGYSGLTRRERDILQHVADGKSIKEIAFALDVSSKTVENLRHTLMEKLQLFSVAALTKFAVRHGLTSNK